LVGALDAALERPELEQAIGTVAAPPGDDHIGAAALTREVRGRLALRRGDREGAREELEAAAATYEAPRRYGANASSWRSALALALAHHDHDRARRLASDELQDARLSGSPRAIGVALRTLALLEGGEQAIDYLGEAVERLEPSYARLEHARALVDLGAALRRANRRVACREPLRAGLELAHRCGATRLRERAQIELQATGARPRRVFTSGAGALTTAERRVADLAVQGMTNPDIAQTLFVTINTVEGHLRHAYQKLSIHSRSQLREALQS
jgi:DNA-binding CsgD family transcriptional regulator